MKDVLDTNDLLIDYVCLLFPSFFFCFLKEKRDNGGI